jgi:hypothetical protein
MARGTVATASGPTYYFGRVTALPPALVAYADLRADQVRWNCAVPDCLQDCPVVLSSTEESPARDEHRFEGEPSWSAYYWELSMNGDGEILAEQGTSDHFAVLFRVDADEDGAFPDLACGQDVVIAQDSQGFIVSFTSRGDYNLWTGA